MTAELVGADEKKNKENIKTCCTHTLELRMRSDEKVTQSARTWSVALTISESICRNEPLLPNHDWLYMSF